MLGGGSGLRPTAPSTHNLPLPDQPSMLATNSLVRDYGNYGGDGGLGMGTTPERQSFNLLNNMPMMNRAMNMSIESRNDLGFSPYVNQRRQNI